MHPYQQDTNQKIKNTDCLHADPIVDDKGKLF